MCICASCQLIDTYCLIPFSSLFLFLLHIYVSCAFIRNVYNQVMKKFNSINYKLGWLCFIKRMKRKYLVMKAIKQKHFFLTIWQYIVPYMFYLLAIFYWIDNSWSSIKDLYRFRFWASVLNKAKLYERKVW